MSADRESRRPAFCASLGIPIIALAAMLLLFAISDPLALTVGLLIFLLIDTFLEAMEVAEGLVGAFQGVPLILFAVLITWLVLLAVGGREHRRPAAARRWRQPSEATHFCWIGAPSGRSRHPGDLGGRLRVLTAARHPLLGDRRGRNLAGDR